MGPSVERPRGYDGELFRTIYETKTRYGVRPRAGSVLGVTGEFDQVEVVIESMGEGYPLRRSEVLSPVKLAERLRGERRYLEGFDVVILACPCHDYPPGVDRALEEFVRMGGFLVTTDWCLEFVSESFPGYVEWSGGATDDEVVEVEIVNPAHPFLRLAREVLGRRSAKWWLEGGSYPIRVLNRDSVEVLLRSEEVGAKYGEDPVLVTFPHGSGRVVHMLSHTHLQRVPESGVFLSALILSNVVDEAVRNRAKLRQPGLTPVALRSRPARVAAPAAGPGSEPRLGATVCPRCGRVNRATARFCIYCGSRLSP